VTPEQGTVVAVVAPTRQFVVKIIADRIAVAYAGWSNVDLKPLLKTIHALSVGA
jgi:hypothetical protein